MKIKKVELTNFKFHKNLAPIEINNNCLIYGENGTGKSSIYEALYSIFKIYFRNKNFSSHKFKNNDSIDNLSVKVTLDNNDELIIPSENYNLPNSISIDNKNTIYFANQDLLEMITSIDNFYEVIKKYLKKYFNTLDIFCDEFNRINNEIDEVNFKQMGIDRETNIDNMKNLLYKIQLRTNDIINHHFEENFYISFESQWGKSKPEDAEYKFTKPKIIIKIDNKAKLKLNFNEAKLKLTSIAIFFALIKLEEDTNNSLKLLVLDDFLTSLDMANRHYIIDYILENFQDYQKIILTHNLQFYNLILNLLKSRDDNSWDNKNIFIRNINGTEEAVIYDKEINYIKQAQDNLDDNRLDEAGIYLRKEFERVIEELRQINEVGAKEKLSKIINQLLKLDDTEDINIKKMQNILKKTKFYQDTILHSTAHDDTTIERYTKELNGAIVILKQLNKHLKSIR